MKANLYFVYEMIPDQYTGVRHRDFITATGTLDLALEAAREAQNTKSPGELKWVASKTPDSWESTSDVLMYRISRMQVDVQPV